MRTTVLPTDPQKRMQYKLAVHNDSIEQSYFSRWMGAEGSPAIVLRKTDLESGPGDEVTTTLTAKLRGKIIREGQKLAGNEMRMDFATHKMRINTHRQGVNCGTEMDAKRMGSNLKRVGRERLTDYIGEVYEESLACHAAGARGVGPEFQQLEASYAGYPNALRAPDTAHVFYGTDGSKAKATLLSTDLLQTKTIALLNTKARTYFGGVQDGKAMRMQQTVRNGKKVWVLVTLAEGIEDIRRDTGTQGWFEMQRALIAAIGKEAEVFQGGAGMVHNTVIDECDVLPKFSDYGAGGTTLALRSLFMGANGLAVAHGSKSMQDGMALELDEDTEDRGNEAVVTFKLTMGVDKVAYTPNSGAATRDFGIIAVDTGYTLVPGNTI
jgi:N4-gp56 family major capsid protein